jgi:CheY-like chemotaxis protein
VIDAGGDVMTEPTPAPRVVLVDDSATMREAIAELLTSRGCTVVGQAADGRAALEIAGRGDVIVVDHRLGDMQGDEVVATLVQRHPGVEVISYSASSDPFIEHRMLAAGASRHFCKSDFTALARHVARHPERVMRVQAPR